MVFTSQVTILNESAAGLERYNINYAQRKGKPSSFEKKEKLPAESFKKIDKDEA